eukprot:gene15823-18075_t
MRPEHDGCYYIDRDGTHFRYILNLLRAPETFKVAMALPASAQEELKCECDYYGLRDMMFPFVQFQPFECVMANQDTVNVTQDLNGIFCVHGLPLRVSRNCGCAESQHWAFNDTTREQQQDSMGMFDIPNFKQAIEEHGGGIQYFTTLSTLRQYPDSMLGAMFSG